METPDNWKMLRSLTNGDTCIIAGNGPSLKEVPASFLEKYDTFGSNRVYKPGGFCPMFYVCVNPLVVEQSLKEIINLGSFAKFITDKYADQVHGSYPLHSFGLPRFSIYPWLGIYEGFTVTFVAMQIAFYLSYKRVLLVGVDHRYTYAGVPNQELVSEAADVNHFSPDYFGPGVHWNAPDLRRSEQAYTMANNLYSSAGRKIINLTPGTSLDIFGKDDLSRYL